jgi:Kef-type K+ transport system membrane component KefB
VKTALNEPMTPARYLVTQETSMNLAVENVWFTAAIWMSLAALASAVAIRVKLASALVEIVIGVLAGNLIALHSNSWIDFIAGFGSIMLTFLAGAEIDPKVLRAQARPAAALGFVSFIAPFLGAMIFARYGLHWTIDASKIAGIAMSTTSVAVVYAVMLETGLAGKNFGQLILAACFITDLGTVVALGLLFATFNGWLLLLAAAIPFSMWAVPRTLPWLFEKLGGRVSEPELRFLFAVILILSAIATFARSEGVLPAYFLGLACAGFLFSNRDISRRLRSMTMSLLTPFYFLKAGTLVSFGAVLTGLGGIAAFFAVKVAAKILGVWPVARAFRFSARDANYLTLMMATGLTFGTISSLYGLTHHYIDQSQYSTLVTVVILTAIVPTLIAQAFFHPHHYLEEGEEAVLEQTHAP